MVIEHVHTTVLIRKNEIKNTYVLNNLNISYTAIHVSGPFALSNIEFTLIYFNLHVFILYGICTKIHIRYFGKCLNYKKNVTYILCVYFGAFNCSFEKLIKMDVLDLVAQFIRTRKKNSIF